MNITVGSMGVADVNVTAVTLRKLVGAYELQFSLRIYPLRQQNDDLIANVRGAEVKLRIGSNDRSLGMTRFPVPLEITGRGVAPHDHPVLGLVLLPNQIQAVEELRNGGNLDFRLAPFGEGRDANGPHVFTDEWSSHVPRSQWIDRLKSADALSVLLIEVPMPFGAALRQMKAAVTSLQDAHNQFLMGEYTACIVACRKALESAGRRLHGKDWQQALDWLGSRRRDMTKTERERAAGAAVHHFMQKAAHSEEAAGEFYDRSEAKFALSMTAAIVSRSTGS